MLPSHTVSTRYFAYGSNMRTDQLTSRCPSAKLVGPATLADHRFMINSRGVATLVPSAGHAAFGVVWRLTNGDLDALDRHEGISIGFYYRVTIAVSQWPVGPEIEAMTYLARDTSPGSAREGYVEGIVAGAAEHGLPVEAIDELASFAG
jgi:hypothetical protein